ncbi:MAG: protocatechuate 3,4-dioxygenase subunit beta [Geminicoccaceae bacterium]|nr:protocatechuate 3,4-dioxygenase subunit beta [Geminicoccaceae bacterium]
MEYRLEAIRPRDRARHPPACFPDYKTSVYRSPRLPLVSLTATKSELTGPVFGHDAIRPTDNDLLVNGRVDGDPIGPRIVLFGFVLDQDARPVPNVLVEIWQANAAGRYRHVNDSYLAPLDPNFWGVGRTLTGADGSYRFRTVRPGPYPWRNRVNDWRPSHIHVSLWGAGLVQRLITQVYFEGDPLLPYCPIYNSIPDPKARARLVAKLDMEQSQPHDTLAWRIDFVLRGPRQTFFENRPEGA